MFSLVVFTLLISQLFNVGVYTWPPDGTNTTTSNACGFTIPSRKDWNISSANISSRMNNLYKRYWSGYQDGNHILSSFLFPEYTTVDRSTVLSAVDTCNIQQKCELLDNCHIFKAGVPTEDQEAVYLFLVSVQNFANYLNYLHELTQSAEADMSLGYEKMIEIFTYQKQVENERKDIEAKKAKKRALVFSIISSVLSAASIAGGVPFISDAIGGTLVAANLADDMKQAADQVKTFVSTVQTGKLGWDLGSAISGIQYAKERLLRPLLDADEKITPAALADLLRVSFNASRDVVEGVGLSLLQGENFTSATGQTFDITNILATGIFSEPIPQVTQNGMRYILQRMYFANIISSLWANENVYIQMSLGNCPLDGYHQGPSVNVVCLDEWKNYVFRAYSLPRYEEKNKHQVASDAPPGWEQLAGPDGYEGITQEMVVRSAVKAFVAQGNVPTEDMSEVSLDNLRDPTSLIDWTPARAGVFNIGVCWNPRGEFTSSLGSWKHGQQFPCECGRAFEDDSPEANSDEEITRRYAGFLDVSGLSQSIDLEVRCVGEDEHSMDCGTLQTELGQFYTRTDNKSFAEWLKTEVSRAGNTPSVPPTHAFVGCRPIHSPQSEARTQEWRHQTAYATKAPPTHTG